MSTALLTTKQKYQIHLDRGTHHSRNSLIIVEHLLVPHAMLSDLVIAFLILTTTLKGKFYPHFLGTEALEDTILSQVA